VFRVIASEAIVSAIASEAIVGVIASEAIVGVIAGEAKQPGSREARRTGRDGFASPAMTPGRRRCGTACRALRDWSGHAHSGGDRIAVIA